MKSWTYFRIILLSLFLGACSRNPLGEDLSQPILNLGFTVSTSCSASLNQDIAFSCTMVADDPTITGITWSLAGATSCAWVSINPATGVITGTPTDNQVGTCQVTVGATTSQRQASPYSFNVQVNNIAPTLTVTNATSILEDAAASIIRNAAAVQASEEGFGTYSFDNVNTTLPRCFDNMSTLSIDPNTGAITYAPSVDYFGTCNIRVQFDDGNGVANSVVASEFSITVTGMNDAPALAAIANQTTNENVAAIVPIVVNDVDNVLTCSAANLTVTSSNVGLVPNGSIAISGTIPNCNLTLTPIALANGLTTITVVASDGVLNTTQTFDLNVLPFPDPPVLAAIGNQFGTEDTALLFTINITDTDSVLACNGTYLSATSSNAALLPVANIVFSGAPPNCNVTMTPVADINGATNLVFTLTDGTTAVTQNFTATYSAVNDAPTISVIGNQTASEDNSIAFNFTIDDVDNVLTCAGSVAATSSNVGLLPVANIVLSGVAPNCTATMTPVSDVFGFSNIGFTVSDGSLSNVRNFTATYNAVNDAPILSAIGSQTGSEDSDIVFNFTISDVDNVVTCAASVSATSSNVALLPVASIVFSGVAPNCTATMTPVADINGVSTIGFTLTDGSLTSVQTFTATYSAVNDTPVLSAIGNQIASEDNSIAVNFTVTDIDSVLLCTSLNLSATSSNAGLLPVANIVYSGTAPNCTATLTPVADANGVSTVVITLADNGAPNLQSTQTFTATYSAINDAPILSAIGNQSMTQDTSQGVNFTISDVDDVVTCAGSMSATSSNVGLLPVASIVFSGVAPNCTATLTPTLLQNGTSNLGFTLTDGTLTDVRNFTLTVSAVNYPPVLSAITNQTASEDNSIAVNFTISDPDNAVLCTGANLSATSSNIGLLPVANIVFSGVAPNCTATLTPVSDGSGTTNIVLSLTDGTNTVTQSFSATYNAINDAPTISAIANQTASEDNSIAVNFTINDVDSVLTCTGSISANSINTALLPVANIVFSGVAPNCTATMTPVGDANGSSALSFTVSDGGLSIGYGFTATFNPVNDAPALSAIGNQTASEDNSIAVNFTITDVDSALNCATSVSATSSNIALLPVANIVFTGVAPNCTATMSPISDTSGVSNISFTLTDGSLTGVVNFTATYNAVNDIPTISVIANQAASEDNSIAVNFTINDIDSALTCASSVVATSSNIALLPVANIVFTGTAPNCTATMSPVSDTNGVSNVGFTVSDGSLSAVQNFTATYNAINDGPSMSAIGNQTMVQDTSLGVNFTINDIDSVLTCAGSVSATSSNVGLLPVANIVFTGVAPNCTATLSPTLLQSGITNLSFTVTDGSLTAVQNFTLTVTAFNYPPVLSAIGNQIGSEDNSIAVNFTISDVDDVVTCAGSLSATSSNVGLLPIASIVFTGVAPNCTATMTPVSDGSGTTNLVFSLTDGSNTVTQSFTATYNAVNDAPTMAAIANQTASEDNSIAVNFTINDIDSVLTCAGSVVATSSNIALLPVANIVFSGTAPNCTATMSPIGDTNGVSTVGFTVTDGGGLTAVQSFTATYNAVNDPPAMPVISNQTTNEDNAMVVNFTITDVDSVLTCGASVVATSSNIGLLPVASIVFSGVAPNCTATMTPVADANGVSTVGFTVTDGGGLTAVQSFTATYSAVNDAPVLSAIGNQTASEDNSIAINFTVNDIDSTLLCTTLNLSATSSNVALLPVANIVYSGTAPNCTATMTPVADANGVSNIVITLVDNGTPNLQNTQSFTATYNAVNDAPAIPAIANQTTAEDVIKVVNFTITDVDSTLNCATSVSATSSNVGLIPVANIVFGGTAPNCTATLTSVADINGVSTLGFTVTDGSLTAVSNFTFTVTAVDDPPIISGIGAQSTTEDLAIVVNFTISDIDSTLTCAGSMSSTSSNTALLPVANIVFTGTAPNCTATMTPVPDGSGTTNVGFIVTDGTTPVTQSFTATYTAINDPPTISAIANQIGSEDNSVAINFTINDVDDTLTCAGSMSATSSDIVLLPVANIVFSGTVPNCTATMTPGLDQSGVTNIVFTVTDGTTPQTQSFSYTVNATDDAPVISAIANQSTNEDITKVVNFTITDADSSLNCVTSMSATSSDTVLLPVANITFGGTAPNCTATMVPVGNLFGTSNIVFTVTDGSNPVTQAFQLTVNSVNDNPTISAIGNQTTTEDTVLPINFTINDVDNTLTCGGSVSVTSSNPTLMPLANIVLTGTAPNCTITFNPVLNKTGFSNISMFVLDGVGGVAIRSYRVTFTAVNDAPTITAIGAQTAVQNNSIIVTFTIADVDDTLTCTSSNLSMNSSDTVLLPNANVSFSGTLASCNATITPAPNSWGVTNVDIIVDDLNGGGNLTATSSFVFTITQTVIKPSSNQSMISLSYSELTPADTANILVTLRDASGNQMTTGGDVVALQFVNDGTSMGTIGAVTDNNNGTYSATLTATTIGTANSITATVGGVPITATSAFTVVGRSCQQNLTAGFSTDGIYTIDPDGASGAAASFNVYCDQTNDGGGWMLAAIPRNATAVFTEANGLVDPTISGPSRNSNIFSKTNSSISFSKLRLTDAWPQTKRNIADIGSAQTFNSLFTTYSSYSQDNVVVSGASITSSIGSTCFVIRGMSANVAAYNGAADWMFMGFHSSCNTPLNSGDNWDTTNGTTQWLVGAHDSANPELGSSSVGFGNGGHWEFSGNNIDTKTILWVK